MKLFYHDESERLGHEQAVEVCQQIYGIEHPERISGFGVFGYKLFDIYLYGRLENWVEDNPDLEEELNEFIRQFMREDYGFVTRDEAYNNSENKWLCGSCCWSIGRYSFVNSDYASLCGGIVLEFLYDRGFLYSIEENVGYLYAEYGREGHTNDIVFIR